MKKESPGIPKGLFTTFLVVCLCVTLSPFALATGTTVWDKASEIMKDIYNQILLISTVAAIVTSSVALLMSNFAKDDRTVSESRAWLKRIIITWAILNSMGFIMSYATPFFNGGSWS